MKVLLGALSKAHSLRSISTAVIFVACGSVEILSELMMQLCENSFVDVAIFVGVVTATAGVSAKDVNEQAKVKTEVLNIFFIDRNLAWLFTFRN